MKYFFFYLLFGPEKKQIFVNQKYFTFHLMLTQQMLLQHLRDLLETFFFMPILW